MHRHSREFVEQNLLVCQRIKYNRFHWWRNWKVRDSLSPMSSPLSKIQNGDFDHSPYYWMAQYALYELEDRLTGTEKDHDVRGLYMEKYRRLMEDYYKDEAKRLEQIVKDFTRSFKISKPDLETLMEAFDGTLEDLYHYLYERYVPPRQPVPSFR